MCLILVTNSTRLREWYLWVCWMLEIDTSKTNKHTFNFTKWKRDRITYNTAEYMNKVRGIIIGKNLIQFFVKFWSEDSFCVSILNSKFERFTGGWFGVGVWAWERTLCPGLVVQPNIFSSHAIFNHPISTV